MISSKEGELAVVQKERAWQMNQARNNSCRKEIIAIEEVLILYSVYSFLCRTIR